MKIRLLSQKRTLGFLVLSLAIIVGYQNCSGPKASSNATGSFPSNLAAQDPLKSAFSSSTLATNGKTQGRLYTLVALQTASGTSTLTSNAFTLQFSADVVALNATATEQMTMVNVTFAAANGCTSQLAGTGQMSRLNGLPLPVGAVSLTISGSTPDTGTCALSLKPADVSFEANDQYSQFLSKVRVMALSDGDLYLQTADGESAQFQSLDSGLQNDPLLAQLLSQLTGKWQISTLLGNPCFDQPGADLCTEIFETINLSGTQMQVSPTGLVTVTTPCQQLTGQLAERGTQVANGPAQQFELTNVTVQSAGTCTTAQLNQSSSVLLVAQALLGISINSGPATIQSVGHNQLQLVPITGP